MNTAYQNFISATSYRAKLMLDQIGPLDQLNVLWAGSPAYNTKITQEDIDSVSSFAGAGLTAQNIADAEYTLATILTNINNSLVALTILANLG